ncbi:Hypp3561 [Branchiostoma lanceolatum]|uniref:Hypp3561 protein n=1 Tax=Branchiostoma lanceolatum TaxID=7740 RepID=A0A8K0A039_BRALA|nr:Hypp3561 [Branchiostoma lanceolatum]
MQRDEKVDVPDAKLNTAVVGVAVLLGALLFAFCCAVIRVRVSRRAAMVPAARPAADTVHNENGDEECSHEEEQDHLYEDCSYDSSHHVRSSQLTAFILANIKFTENSQYNEDSNQPQAGSAIAHGVLSPRSRNDTHNISSALKPAEDVADSLDGDDHFYENDKDLQEGMVAHGEDAQDHVYDNSWCDNCKESEVLDHDVTCQGGLKDDCLKKEPADHEFNPTVQVAETFAHKCGSSMDRSSDQQRTEVLPTIPPRRVAVMTADESIANKFGGENVCTYIFMKGNDTYEDAGTDNSREEPGGA